MCFAHGFDSCAERTCQNEKSWSYDPMTRNLLSRRKFLGATLAASSAPFLLPSNVWAAATPPNDRIQLGFIGMGTQNRGLMSGFLRKPQTRVVAVCDVDTTRRMNAQTMVRDFYSKQGSTGTCEVYEDFRDLLARKDVDAVVVATPDHWHALISIAAAKAGKDIYCEKPLCQSIHEARAMVKAVRKNQRIFQTGSMQRSSKEFRVGCELVRNGVIGKISTVEASVGGPGMPCDLPAENPEPGLNWDLWLGPAPNRPYHSELSPRGVHKHFPNWRRYREYGGGGVTDWGAHHFDIAQWGLGMDASGPVEITPASGPNPTFGVRAKYANGVELIHSNGDGVVFHGSEGKVQVNRGKFSLWLGSKLKSESAAECEGIARELLKDGAERLYASSDHLGDWLNSIRTRKLPICDVEVGARTVTVCHLINLAYYHGQKMQWDPKREKFVNGHGNPSWLDVKYRGKWKLG